MSITVSKRDPEMTKWCNSVEIIGREAFGPINAHGNFKKSGNLSGEIQIGNTKISLTRLIENQKEI